MCTRTAAAGVDVNAAGYDDLCRLSAFFASQGVTGFLASILTDTVEGTERAIDSVCAFMDAPRQGREVPGHPAWRAPSSARSTREPCRPNCCARGTRSSSAATRRARRGRVRYMTVAPEVPGVLDMLGEIRGECTLAIGHSDADYETAVRAIDAGVESCTHTFNVMSLFHSTARP